MNKWDLYNDKFQKTDKTILETENIPDGFYHYTLNIWIINNRKEILLFRNRLNNKLYYPGFWGCIDENVLFNETPIESCNRAVQYRFNNSLEFIEIDKIDTKIRNPYHYIYETYIIKTDMIEIRNIKFDKQYSQAKWVDKNELKNMIDNGEISQVIIPRIEKYVYPII